MKKEEIYTNMSTDFLYTGMEDFYSTEKSKKNKEKSKNKLIKLLVLMLSLVLVIEAFVYFMVIPSTSSVSLEFANTSPYVEANLKKQLSSLTFQNWFEFDTNYAFSLILEDSAVDTVKITKRFPNKVVISVKERIPVAFTLVNEKDKIKTYYIDKDGILFQNKNTAIQQDLPLLSGLDLTNIDATNRLSSRDRRVLEQIVSIQESKPDYLSVLSEIAINEKENGSFNLILYPLYSRVKIVTERLLNESSLEYMMIALDIVKELKQEIPEIDLRYGSISYKN